MSSEPFRVPDKIFLALAVLLVVGTWVLGIASYSVLPDRVPTHFNFEGQADAYNVKSFWTVFFAPLIQLVMTAGFFLLYRKPKYMNIPGTLLLELLDEPHRTQVYRLMKHMTAVILVLLNALFAYLMIAITASANGEPEINPWILLALIGLLLLESTVYSVWAARLVHRVVREKKQQTKT